MEKQLIKILENQLEKLSDPDFDLEAWKSSACSALDRVYGKGNDRSAEIQSLRIDYSSWALRDSNSKYQPKESTKKHGKEVIQSVIDEIKVFGVPKPKAELLSEFFSKADVEKLLSEESGKQKLIKKLKKEEMLELIERLIGNRG